MSQRIRKAIVCCDCCDVNFSNIVDGQKGMIAIAKAVKKCQV